MTAGVGIIGCGLIGTRRARALGAARLVACADLDLSRAHALVRAVGQGEASAEWRSVIRRQDVDVVVVSTMNDSLAEITLAAMGEGKHVLVEKPAARSADELEPLLEAEQRLAVRVRVGFNHRYHPALLQARELVDRGELGDLMFVRGRYGHGGRIGYDKEWRADPARSGGGELIDQGVHLIDLARMLLGEFVDVSGYARTFFWDMPVDDNAFLLLKTAQQKVASLHVSCTEWKNLFSLEIYGRQGKLHAEGLGGSYGLEKLFFYKMRPEMGPPDTIVWEYPRGDRSWEIEFQTFLQDIETGRRPDANLTDAYEALRIVKIIYKGSGYDHHT